jgi:hypothetical protein
MVRPRRRFAQISIRENAYDVASVEDEEMTDAVYLHHRFRLAHRGGRGDTLDFAGHDVL